MPEWANFFTAKEHSFFITEIEKYFNDLSVRYGIFDGFVQVEGGQWEFNQLGLVNVGQVCKQDNPWNYRQIIQDHFDALKSSYEFNLEFDKLITDFDKVKKYLAVRLYSKEYFEQFGLQNTIGDFLSDDLYSTLVFDLPYSISNVKPEQAAKWTIDHTELFKIGIENVKQNHSWEITQEEMNGFKIWFIQSDHFFAPNIIFDLKHRIGLTSEHGMLIGIPHRHAVLIYPIKDLEVVTAINGLIPIIHGMNQEGPGSITNELYYFKDGLLTNIPYELSENKMEISPPEIFLNVLNSFK